MFPTNLLPETLFIPETLDISFEGFPVEAFQVLERLREEPRIERYRIEKEALRTFVQNPFKTYRDDLVVNWVLPNGIGFETERNVFSRILENDFGAGGCRHHLWLSFYRPGLTRLTDIQLIHSLHPEGFKIGLYAGRRMGERWKEARKRIDLFPEEFASIQKSLESAGFKMEIERSELFVVRLIPRERVLAVKGRLVKDAIELVRHVWPLYRFLVRE